MIGSVPSGWVLREHVPLLSAIIDGDTEKAAALSSQHITGFVDAIRALIYGPAPDVSPEVRR